MDPAAGSDAPSFSPYSPPATLPPPPTHAAGTVRGMLAEAWRRLSERPFLLLGASLVVWVPADRLSSWLVHAYFGPLVPQGGYYLQSWKS